MEGLSGQLPVFGNLRGVIRPWAIAFLFLLKFDPSGGYSQTAAKGMRSM